MIGTSQSRVKIRALSIISAIIAVIVFALLLLVLGESSRQGLIKTLTRFTLIVGTLTLFWWWLDRFGWRQIPVLGRAVRDWPNIQGRWEGTIDRDGPDPPHPFVLEIYQTLTALRCSTYSENGDSHSIVANVTVTEDGEHCFLVYVWLGGTSGKIRRSKSGMFYGTTELRLSDGNSDRTLKGTYWTNRTPHQTKGDIELTYTGPDLRKDFE